MENNVEKNSAGIESYDGADAYYEGTDKDYEDFLKKVDGNASAAAASVEGSNSVPGGDTINIRGVIDMVRKKAGEIGVAAKKIGGEVKEQITDYISSASERAEEKKAADASNTGAASKKTEILDAVKGFAGRVEDDAEAVGRAVKDAIPDDVSASVSKTAAAAREHIRAAAGETRERLVEMASIGGDIDKISSGVDTIIAKLDTAGSRINDLEVTQIESRNSYDRGVNDLRVSINEISGEISEIKQNMLGVTKLSDAVFDLRNNQQNSKKSLTELEEKVISLRRKITAGITVFAVLSAVMIALEIINLLS